MRLRVTAIMFIALFGVCAVVSAPQAAPQDPTPDFRERLVALDPANPMAYFELAEDLMRDRPDAEGRALARTLLALAYELDRRASEPIGLGRSACLALAEIAETPGEAEWLMEVARSFGPGGSPAGLPGLAGSGVRSVTSAQLQLAEAIGHARDDEGKRAQTILRRPEVAPLVGRVMADLGPGRRTLETIATKPHCIGCAGRRAERVAVGNGFEFQPCPVCLGNPGLRLSAAEFLATLRVESQLLNAPHAFWSAQLLADQGAPLREPDPAELARAYGADPARPYWSAGEHGLAGEWIRSAATTPADAQP